MLMKRGAGCLPDPKDSRDMLFGAHFGGAKLVGRGSVRTELVPTRNQGRTNSCVGFATAAALRVASVYQLDKPFPDISPLHIYFGARGYHSKDIDGDGILDPTDDGTYIRAAIRSVKRMGAPAESTWPFSARKVNKQPGFAAMRSGLRRAGPRHYYRCVAADDIRLAIDKRVPVIGGFPMSENWTRAHHDLVPPLISAHEGRFVGNHAMVVESYNEDGTFDVWNTSWTLKFGYKGRCRVTEDVLMTGHDFWGVML